MANSDEQGKYHLVVTKPFHRNGELVGKGTVITDPDEIAAVEGSNRRAYVVRTAARDWEPGEKKPAQQDAARTAPPQSGRDA